MVLSPLPLPVSSFWRNKKSFKPSVALSWADRGASQVPRWGSVASGRGIVFTAWRCPLPSAPRCRASPIGARRKMPSAFQVPWGSGAP